VLFSENLRKRGYSDRYSKYSKQDRFLKIGCTKQDRFLKIGCTKQDRY